MTDTTDIAALRKRLQSAISQHEMMMGCVMGLSRVDPMYQQCLDALDALEAERQRADDLNYDIEQLQTNNVELSRECLQYKSEIAALKANVLVMPDNLHQDTKALLLVFASAMAVKLHKAEKKYGYDNSWKNDNWQRECQRDLLVHVNKGDPLDVANYCAFMNFHGWSTAVKGE